MRRKHQESHGVVRVAIPTGETAWNEAGAVLGVQPAYLDVLHMAGVMPIMLHPRDLSDAPSVADALLVPGGPDLHPFLYGMAPSNEVKVRSPYDAYEVDAIRELAETGFPMCLVCLGMQALNVARGGTLAPDVPHHTGGGTHPIRVDSGSFLAMRLRRAGWDGESELSIVTKHHQAIDRIGDGLVAVATAPDGIIEAVEDPRHKLLLALEGHAELTHGWAGFPLIRQWLIEVAAAVA